MQGCTNHTRLQRSCQEEQQPHEQSLANRGYYIKDVVILAAGIVNGPRFPTLDT